MTVSGVMIVFVYNFQIGTFYGPGLFHVNFLQGRTVGQYPIIKNFMISAVFASFYLSFKGRDLSIYKNNS